MSIGMIIQPSMQQAGASPFTVLQATLDNTLVDQVSGESFTQLRGAAPSYVAPGPLSKTTGLRGDACYYELPVENCLFEFDFTVEMWFRFNGSVDSGQGTYHFAFQLGDIHLFEVAGIGGGISTLGVNPAGSVNVGSTPVVLGTWHHIAIARKDTVFRWFVDGTQIGYGTSTATHGGSVVKLFSLSESSSEIQLISCVRATNGQALYQADFTPAVF